MSWDSICACGKEKKYPDKHCKKCAELLRDLSFGCSDKPSKYRNKKTIIDGITFDSKKEAVYYWGLQFKKEGNIIKDFSRQVRYEVVPATDKFRKVEYVADFVVEYFDGRKEVVDVKSEITRTKRDYVIKKKLMYWRCGIEILER